MLIRDIPSYNSGQDRMNVDNDKGTFVYHI